MTFEAERELDLEHLRYIDCVRSSRYHHFELVGKRSFDWRAVE
jgi:hypothetical protein